MVSTIISYVFVGLFALCALSGLLNRARRLPLWLGAVFAGSAAFASFYDAFWPMVSFGCLLLWALISAVNVVDVSWRMRTGLVLTVASLAFITLWPTLEGMSGGRLRCPAYVKGHVSFRLVSGLDLRGGMRLVYTVDVDEAIKDKRDRYYEDMRRSLAKIFKLHEGDEVPSEAVYVKLREKVDLVAPPQRPNEIHLAVKPGIDATKVDARFMEAFRGDLTYSRSQDGRSYDFKVKEATSSQIRERAVSQAREIILRRVDELGLREASVSTRDEDIIVEVPGEGEKDFANIREIISQTARLEFKLLDDDTDVFGPVNQKLQGEKEDAASLPPGLSFAQERVPLGKDPQGELKAKTNTYAQITKQPKETSQKALGRLKDWVSGVSLPQDREVGYEIVYKTDPDTLKQTEDGWRTYLLKSRADITGDMIREASAMPSQDSNQMGGWYVALTFTDQGGSIFGKVTGANVQRRFAIILDGRVESSPVIKTAIPGGHAQITMGASDPELQLRDARKLELVLRSGALPAPISPTNEQRIGPSLGRDSIQLAVQGALGGGILVLLFMLVYYHRAGLIADISVLLNLFMQLAILAAFGASMTLPGIAGLALTIGIGVDGSVLINERIRDELRAGKSPRAAVEVGFARALSAIIDGHVTILISGIILAQYGTGPIKGFAITLMVGVVCNVFTCVLVNRVMFDLWVRTMGRNARLNMG